MSERPESWPQAAGQLLPTTLFNLAKQYPNLIYAEYFSDSEDVARGYRKVTYEELNNAVHAMAWWIDKNVGKPMIGNGSETMVYFGPNDLSYGILVLASIITGYKVCYSCNHLGDLEMLILCPRCSSHLLATAPKPSQS
jgi:hypothetical protein